MQSPLSQVLTDAGAKASAVTDSVVPQTPIADEMDEAVDFGIIRNGRRRRFHQCRKNEAWSRLATTASMQPMRDMNSTVE